MYFTTGALIQPTEEPIDWKTETRTVVSIFISVQAEYEIFATPTFLDPFDLRKLLAGHFFPSGIVFTYPQGPLALGS